MNVSIIPAGPGAAQAPAYTPPPPAAPSVADAPGGPAAPIGREQLEAAIEKANQTLTKDGSVRFAVHDSTNRVVVRIVDPRTMEIIREFPDSDFLDMMAKLQELAGLQVNVRT